MTDPTPIDERSIADADWVRFVVLPAQGGLDQGLSWGFGDTLPKALADAGISAWETCLSWKCYGARAWKSVCARIDSEGAEARGVVMNCIIVPPDRQDWLDD